MGKQIIILAAGMSILITIVIMALNSNTGQAVDTTANFYKEQQARIIANSGVEIYLEKLRENKSLTGTFLHNNLMNGFYDMYISGPDTALNIKSVGEFYDKNHTALVTAKRDPIQMPDVNSALYVSANSMNLNLNGNVDINGNDINMDGSSGSGSPKPGIGVDTPADSEYIVKNVKPKITKSIKGSGGTPSVSTVNDTTNWQSLTQNIIFAADNTLPGGTYTSGDFGTLTQPQITYVNGDVNLEGTMSGYGIMVINGDLTLTGTFDFYGIIILYGNSTITTDVIGTFSVYGGTILVGSSVDIKATGTSQLYYSSQAINNAKVNLKSSRFTIVSWWE